MKITAVGAYTEMYSRGRRGAPAKGVGRVTGARVQISPSPPKIRNVHSGIPYFSFCAEMERFFTPTPQFAKRTAAQITKQSRVGKLAFQRGGEGCSRERCAKRNVARSATACAVCSRRSRVQTRFHPKQNSSICFYAKNTACSFEPAVFLLFAKEQ